MSTSMPNAGQSAYYTIRQATWILGVDRGTVSRAIRTGALRTTQRRGNLVVPASALARLLGEATDQGERSGGTP